MATKQISRSQGRELVANPGLVLRDDAAQAWDRAVKEFGKSVLLTGAWRSYGVQASLFEARYEQRAWPYSGPYGDVRWWKGLRYVRMRGAAAAVPGTSNHGGGIAVDVKTRRYAGDPPHSQAVVFTAWNDPDRVRFLKVAAKHGWDDDEGRQVNELWHLTYYPSRDQKRGTGGTGGSGKKRKPKKLATVKRGKKSGRIKLWQRILRDEDYGIAADGKFGPATERSTKHWQTSRGLVSDGIAGPRSWARAIIDDGPVQRGNRCVHVELVQLICGAKRDGVFGAGTQEAVRRVQSYLGAKPDGVFGPDTVRRLTNHWT